MTAATPRLLLVDDESSITDGLAPFLARSGFEVRVAPDGQQAWDLIAGWQPDIVVSDVMMPVMNGCGEESAKLSKAGAASWAKREAAYLECGWRSPRNLRRPTNSYFGTRHADKSLQFQVF